jgi:hypothetical protein
MENKASRKHIADGITLGFKVFDIDNFRSNVARRATPHKQILLLIGPSSQPKIGNDNLIVIVIPEEYIFGLEIPMHDPLTMHAVYARQQPMHDFPRLIRRELMPRLDFVKQLTALEQLHRNVNGIIGLEDAVQLHNVLVVELAHEGHFIDERLLAFLLGEGGLF